MTLTAAATTSRRDVSDAAVPIALLFAGAALRFLAYVAVSRHPSPQGFVDAMCVWDCTWYADIAAHGYQAQPEVLNFGGPAGIAGWAFFPLYPLLLATLGKLIPLGPAAVGMLVSPLLTLGAALAARPLFGDNRRGYFLFAGLLLAGPFSFYFAVPYSESLFLLLTVLAFVRLGRRDYLGAGLAAALLSATRTVGVLFVFAMLAELYFEFGRKPLRELFGRPDILLGLLLTPLGLFGFMAWLYVVTGDALAFAHIQRGWDRELVNPIAALWSALASPVGQVRDAPLLGVSALAGLLLSGALVWRRQFPAALFCGLCLVLALTEGVESMLRFVAALAPLGVVFCQLLARWRWLFWLSLAVFAALDFELSIGWMHQQGLLM